MFVFVLVCLFVCVCVCVCMTYVCVCVRAYVCVSVCIRESMCVCVIYQKDSKHVSIVIKSHEKKLLKRVNKRFEVEDLPCKKYFYFRI